MPVLEHHVLLELGRSALVLPTQRAGLKNWINGMHYYESQVRHLSLSSALLINYHLLA